MFDKQWSDAFQSVQRDARKPRFLTATWRLLSSSILSQFDRVLAKATRCDVRKWRKNTVYDAFVARETEGTDKAMKILQANSGSCPAGALALFRAMDAVRDDDWLKAINAWAEANGLPGIILIPGDKSRFYRLGYATTETFHASHKVSVIMTAFNSSQTIERAAESILRQSWQNLELVIVDDCSTDSTVAIVKKLAAVDRRVRILRNSRNVGPFASKNRAIGCTTGRYITCHDADDLAIPTRIADQMRPILENPNCVATLGHMIRINLEGAFSFPSRISRYSYDGVARRCLISLLVDRDVLLQRIGYWDTVRFGADSEMVKRVSGFLGERYVEIKNIIMLMLDREGSLTNHPEHGTARGAMTPIRRDYGNSWASWHAATSVGDRYIPFPHIPRLFDAPAEMKVPDDDLRAVADWSSFEVGTPTHEERLRKAA
ncbi:MAG: glycosyltransferase family 2 protein [Planctomycetota bacterium]|nr:glycosyltransferase family 2 protein [Planctomycetota bacterium]